MDKLFDTIIKNARVVRPNKTSVDCLDIAIKNGKIAQVRPTSATWAATRRAAGKPFGGG